MLRAAKVWSFQYLQDKKAGECLINDHRKQSLELPSPLGIKLCHPFSSEPPTFLVVLGQISTGQHPSRQRIVDHPVQSVPAKGRDQVVLWGTVDGVVRSLVERWPHEAVVLADYADFGDLALCRSGNVICALLSASRQRGWLTSEAVKLDMANVLILPCLWTSLMASRVS